MSSPVLRTVPAITRDLRMWASRALTTSLAPPDWLSVNLTLRCNLSCVMCTTCYDSPELTTREVLDLIDQAADWGVGVFNPLGGEPFIRADLEVILTHAARRDMHTTLTTNGTLIRSERAATVAKIPVEKLHINISIDGPEAAHDAVRGEGSWRRTMAGYRALRQADEEQGNPRRKVCANVILNRRNVTGFVEFVRSLGALGFDGVQVLNLFRDRDDDTVGGMWFDAASLPELEVVVRALQDEPLVLNAAADLRLVPRYYREGLSPLDAPCWAGWKELYVNADGSVIMCDGKLDFLAGRYGSVREATLRQLWSSPTLKERREVVKRCATPCIQNCYLRRDSDSAAPLLGELVAVVRATVVPHRNLRTIELPVAFELSDVSDDAETAPLRALFARSPVPFAALCADPGRLAELRDRHYLDFGRGFLGAGVVVRILDAAGAAGWRFGTVCLRWRGEPLFHPDLSGVLGALRGRVDRVVLHSSGLLLPDERIEAEVWAEPALAGAQAGRAEARARSLGVRIGTPPLADGPAISWEGRVTASRLDTRLAERAGDVLKEPFGPLWARVTR
ncbi:MAG: radical SAM protein [Myxococcales bacterium]|nr:radical SAM protein [Myxococcales bacterium]